MKALCEVQRRALAENGAGTSGPVSKDAAQKDLSNDASPNVVAACVRLWRFKQFLPVSLFIGATRVGAIFDGDGTICLFFSS